MQGKIIRAVYNFIILVSSLSKYNSGIIGSQRMGTARLYSAGKNRESVKKNHIEEEENI